MKIAFASDHAGFILKQNIMQYLQQKGIETYDFGCDSQDSCDYPDFAHPLAQAVEKNEFDFGIVICSTGNGITMTANKHQKIRAALCWQPQLATLARQHNDANVLGLPANFVSQNEAIKIVDAFLDAEFEGGRHLRRVNKIPLAE